eukprot:1386010-Amorphochlora_amoeboformis.AAC.2
MEIRRNGIKAGFASRTVFEHTPPIASSSLTVVGGSTADIRRRCDTAKCHNGVKNQIEISG